MKFLGAKIREQNVTFGIVAVKPYVLQNPAARENMQDFGVRVFGYIPIVLMAKNARGVPTYWGRQDIVKFLAKVPPQCIPWMEYTIAA